METITFNNQSYTLTEMPVPSDRLLSYDKNYVDVEIGEEFDFEMTAPAIDAAGKTYEVRWIFSDIKGSERALDEFDYSQIDQVIEL